MGEYDELIAKLESLKGDVRKAALRKSLRAMGTVVQEAIKVRAPSQAGEYAHGDLAPGELAADIKVSVHIAADEKATEDSDRVTIGPSPRTAYIARFVEDGHATRPVNGKPRNRDRKGRAEPHPFVRPAFDVSKDKAIEVFGQVMAEEIEKAVNA